MRYKTWPPEPFGPGNLDLADPVPLEKQPKVRTRYIWNIPQEEWPAGITAEEVAEMKRRHDKEMQGKWERRVNR